jgi:hypothetical protein
LLVCKGVVAIIIVGEEDGGIVVEVFWARGRKIFHIFHFSIFPLLWIHYYWIIGTTAVYYFERLLFCTLWCRGMYVHIWRVKYIYDDGIGCQCQVIDT